MLPFSGNCGLLCYLYSPGVGARSTAWTWKLESCFPKSLLALHQVDPKYQTQPPCWAMVPSSALLARLLRSKCFLIFNREWTKSKRVCRNQGQVRKSTGQMGKGTRTLVLQTSRAPTPDQGGQRVQEAKRPGNTKDQIIQGSVRKKGILGKVQVCSDVTSSRSSTFIAYWMLQLGPASRTPTRLHVCILLQHRILPSPTWNIRGASLSICSLICPQQQKRWC